jgi:hypothetical protein
VETYAELGSSVQNMFGRLCTSLDIRRPVKLLISADHTMPMTWGILFPKVLLPAEAMDLPPARLRMAMLHELAHVKRFDALAQLLGQLATALYWFHPLVWLAAGGLWREQERAADDLVLSIDRNAADYAQLLLDLASRLRGSALQAGAIGMARRRALESRLTAVLDASRRRGQTSARLFALGMLLMLGSILPLAAVQSAAQQSKPVAQEARTTARLTGHVVSPDGKPVAGAQVVYFLPWHGGSPRQVLSTQTDQVGAFAIDAPLPEEQDQRQRLAARAAGLAPAEVDATPNADNRIELGLPSAIRVSFQMPDGSPAVGVRARPAGSTIGIVAGGSWSSITYPPAWSGELAQTTDAQGACVFDLPRRSSTLLQIDDPRFAQPSYSSRVKTDDDAHSQPATIRLTRAGSVRGSVIYADSGKPAPGIHLIALARSSGEASHGAYGEVVTDQLGQYSIGQMGPGTYIIHINEHARLDWTAAFLKDVKVSPGQITYVPDLKLVKGSVVRGRVFKSDSGEALAHVAILAVDLDSHEFPDNTITDANGNFMLRLPPGRARLQLQLLPPQGYSMDGFDGRNQDTQRQLLCVEGQDLNVDLKLTPKKGLTVVGRVLDPAGHPAAGARVVVTDTDTSFGSSSSVTADGKGAFTLRGLSSPTRLQAYADKMSTVTPVIVNGGEENVTLQLSPFNSVSVTGTITDLNGQPQKGIWIKIASVMGGGTFQTSSEPDLLSDAQGRFTIPHLASSGTYFLQIGGERFWEKHVDLKFKPDQPTLDLGQIKLEAKY